jgi:hypothetical protein
MLRPVLVREATGWGRGRYARQRAGCSSTAPTTAGGAGNREVRALQAGESRATPSVITGGHDADDLGMDHPIIYFLIVVLIILAIVAVVRRL